MMMMMANARSKKDEEPAVIAARVLQRFFKNRWKYSLRRVMRRRQTRLVLREIFFFVIFLGCFTSSAVLEVQDDDIFYYGNNVKGQLTTQEFFEEDSHVVKTFEEIRTVEEWYQWAHGPLLNTLYTSGTWAGGDEAPFPGYVFGIHKLVGGVRIGQLRVKKNDVCPDAVEFAYREGGHKCYGGAKGEFTLDDEDKRDFGDLDVPFTWNGWGEYYRSVEEDRALGEYATRRHVTAIKFPPPAFGVIMPNSGYEEAQAIVRDLAVGNYIDEQTRVVTVDFTLLNPGMMYFLVIRISAEVSHAGGVIMTYEAMTVRQYSYFDGLTWFKKLMEGIVTLFYMYYFVREVRRGRNRGMRYFMNTDAALHNINIVVFVFVCVGRLISMSLTPSEASVVVDSDIFYDFGPSASVRKISVYLNAINAFLCWFKLIRYLSYAPSMALVVGTLGRSAGEVVGFMVIFAITFYGFAAAHMMSFGALVFDYRNMTQAMLSLITSLLGDFDLDELARAQWLLGPAFFIVFVALAVFVVLNVLIAIISDAYTATNEELLQKEDVKVGAEIVEYVWDTIYGIPILGPKLKNMAKKAHIAKKKLQMEGFKTAGMKVGQGMMFVKRSISRASSGGANGNPRDSRSRSDASNGDGVESPSPRRPSPRRTGGGSPIAAGKGSPDAAKSRTTPAVREEV
mmetsp:Transcript_9536/g.33511  ORF Transcript_9536/g.33511 Transcript_9536/m.33511 type:complete len:678 (-) Transcript_9536:100-2133(-)